MKKFLTGIALLFILMIPVSAQTLIPGGFLVGVHLENDTVTVTDVVCGVGLQKGDQILSVDETPIHCVQDIRSALENCGKTVTVTVLRGDKTKTLTLSPTVTAAGKKLGVTLRTGVSGLGTVTFYDPDTHRYGALGHSVNGTDGQPVFLKTGSVYPASVVSVTKGQSGKPGQLLGQLQGDTALGTIEKNVRRGIFGKAKFAPDEPLPVASRDQVHTGAATIRSTVSDNGTQEYSVEILRIYPESNDRTRDFLIRVTDEALLAATGGIVQGMSGSPIIQDGKLIGAVTHVLVNDPTTGYGIFIENMLDAA